MADDVVITGLPRAGTTLVTALVDSLKDSAALSEPEEVVALAYDLEAPDAFARATLDFHRRTRRALWQGRPVRDTRDALGSIQTDYIRRDEAGARVKRCYRPVHLGPLTPECLLASKHNALYTATLPQLIDLGAFDIVAVIRDPVDLLTSWGDVPFPIAKGRLPGAERYWSVIHEIVSDSGRVVEKQARILEAFVKRYLATTDSVEVLRYEEVVDDPRVIAERLGREMKEPVPINTRTKDPLSTRRWEELSAVLRDLAPTAWRLYR